MTTPKVQPEPRDLFAEGQRFGEARGDATGYDRGCADTDALWTAALGIARRHAQMPTEDELRRRRTSDPVDPCPTRCQKCSRCVRSVAWWARGGADHPGGPVAPW